MPHDDRHPLLSTLPPSRGQRRLALVVLLILAAASLATVPVAAVPLPATGPVVPAYATAVLMNDLITAALLYALHAVQRSRAVLALAVGYLFCALTIIPWALTFPGAFAPEGLLGVGLQGTAAIAAARRLGFPLFVIAYALMRDEPARWDFGGARWRGILASILAVVAAVGGMTWLAVGHGELLPEFMVDRQETSALWDYVPGTAAALCVVAAGLVWLRRRTVLGLWLTVALFAWFVESLLLGFVSSGRLSVGWWAGRLYGLLSASVVLMVLLAETMALYGRLVRSVTAERRTREARLTTMEALSGSIAHEVNQPLASMIASAAAGLRWLDRARPDLAETRTALRRIVEDGHRAGRVVEGVRAVFRKGVPERVPLDVNELVRQALRHAEGELRLNRITVRTDLEGALPPVVGSPVQLQQVLSNLIANALDAMDAVTHGPRVLRIRTARQNAGEVLVSVEDSGAGLDPAQQDRLFEPFFTTKPHGMGLGLLICRSIVEAHGGRLWMAGREPQGAVGRFLLPVGEGAGLPVQRAAD